MSFETRNEDCCSRAVSDSGGGRGNVYSPRAFVENISDCMYVYREKGKEKGRREFKEISIKFSAGSNCDDMTSDNTIFCKFIRFVTS